MNTIIEHFYKVTAINGFDLVHNGMRPNPVSVTFCPVDIEGYQSSSNLALLDNGVIKQVEYIDKTVNFLREQVQELGDFVDVSVNDAEKVLVDSIKAAWNGIMNKGHTAGIMIEGIISFGVGVVGGFFIAFDRTGRSTLGFVGMAAGATVGGSGVFGGFYYEGSRDGLEGFGGEFNASIAGLEWEAMFTGGNLGHTAAVTLGGNFAVSLELQYAWLISESDK